MAKTSSNSSVTIIEEKNAVIVTGILSQNVDKTGFKGKGGVKRNISIKMVAPLTEKERNILAKMCKTTIDDKYCPHAIKEEKEYFTVKTMYDIPVRIDDKTDIEEPTLDNIGLGSVVRLACKCKENAIYPSSMVVDELKIFNPFELLD